MNKFVAMMMFVALAFSSQMVMAQPPPPVETTYPVTTIGAEYDTTTAAFNDAAAKYTIDLEAAMVTEPGPGETVFMNSSTLMGPYIYTSREVWDAGLMEFVTMTKVTIQGGFKTFK